MSHVNCYGVGICCRYMFTFLSHTVQTKYIQVSLRLSNQEKYSAKAVRILLSIVLVSSMFFFKNSCSSKNTFHKLVLNKPKNHVNTHYIECLT